jgi:hypothetical protein
VHGDPHAIALLARARDGFERAGRYGDAHMATMMWAMSCAFLGDVETARTAAGDYLAEAEACGAEWAYTWTLWVLGLVELRHGDVGRSAALLRETLSRQYDIDDCWGPVWAVEALAWSTAASDRHHRAAELLGVAYRMRKLAGVTLTGLRPFQDLHAVAERRAWGVLGEDAYRAAFTRGSQVTNVQRFVLEEGHPGEAVPGRARTPPGPHHGE